MPPPEPTNPRVSGPRTKKQEAQGTTLGPLIRLSEGWLIFVETEAGQGGSRGTDSCTPVREHGRRRPAEGIGEKQPAFGGYSSLTAVSESGGRGAWGAAGRS